MKKDRNLRSVNTDGGVNLQYKLLSAIGIIIIVSGHCYHGGMELAYNWFPPYSYNLALFVFISGYFYKTDYEENVGKYIWKRTKRLLIPAYLWNIFYGGMVAFLGLFGFTIGAKPDLYNLFVMPFVDGEAFQYNLGSWFVYPLFLVCIINVLFRKFLKLIHLDNEFIVLIVYLAIGMIGINTAIENPTAINGIVKLLVRTMFFLPCYEFGRFYKAVLEKKDTLNNVAYFAIIFAVQLILLTFCKDLEYTPSSFTKFNNGFIIPYISSITAIAFWLRVSRLLVPAIGNSKLVRLIADNTYGIMVNQLVGFMCLKFVFYGLSRITSGSLFGDFNVTSFKSSIWYYYLPNGLQQWAFVYLIFGLFVPILISIILNKICHIAQKHIVKFCNK